MRQTYQQSKESSAKSNHPQKVAQILEKLTPEVYQALMTRLRHRIGKWSFRRAFLHKPALALSKRKLTRMATTGALGATLLFTAVCTDLQAADITVTTANATETADGECDLIEAIKAANNDNNSGEAKYPLN